MAKDNQKRLGKKHRQASTRPKKGRSPKVAPTTGAVDPRKRKVLATKKAAAEKKKHVPMKSPDREAHVPLRQGERRPPASVRPVVARPAKAADSQGAQRAGLARRISKIGRFLTIDGSSGAATTLAPMDVVWHPVRPASRNEITD